MNYLFLGQAELLTAFRLAGVDGEAVNDSATAHAVFTRITEGPPLPASPPAGGERDAHFALLRAQSARCQVLILTEQVALWLGDALTEWQLSGRYPLIVEVPGLSGPLAGKKSLVDSIREAIGVHV